MILITGASSGIGYELAKLYAKDHCDLVLVARNLDKLSEIKNDLEKEYNVKVYVYSFDLSKKESCIDLFKQTEEDGLLITTLVNNAGYGDYGEFVSRDLNKTLGMIELNNAALVTLTYLYAGKMKERKEGMIINIGSIASFVPGPFMSVYYATKSFVLSFSESLRYELLPYNVRVCALCPGPTKTNFFNNSGVKNDKKAFTEKTGLMDVTKVAEYGYRRFKKNKMISIPGFANRSAIRLAKFMPRAVVRKFVGKLQKSRKD